VTLDLTDETSLSNEGNSLTLSSPPNPPVQVYPSASSSDASYDLSEAALRAAVRIPTGFTYGVKPPVILVPGTASTGYLSFEGSYIPLLSGAEFADPVWLDIPSFSLGDAQTNAEYVAYAINYVASLASTNVSVVAWSQGNLLTQWSLKYWPSTRSKVTDFVALSADFHGTLNAYLLCGGIPLALGCTPSIAQQVYGSKFVAALRSNGGDSAYVPTTSVYSSTDEIVEPQSGVGASAYLLDVRGVGVTNVDIQSICGVAGAGGIVSHQGVLYNALAYALAVDALTNIGPGELARIDTTSVCEQAIAPGLGVDDVMHSNSEYLKKPKCKTRY
jgi:hypothetical protein